MKKEYTENDIANIYNKGIVEGTKHTQPSKRTLQLIEYVEEKVDKLIGDWESIRSRVFWGALGSVTLMVGIGIWVGTMQSSISFIQERINNRTEDRFYKQDGERLEVLINGNTKSIESIEGALLRIEDKIDALNEK